MISKDMGKFYYAQILRGDKKKGDRKVAETRLRLFVAYKLIYYK
jgi:uncharacterized protein (DUF2164 family)